MGVNAPQKRGAKFDGGFRIAQGVDNISLIQYNTTFIIKKTKFLLR